jgi:hypothetical protein
MGQGRGEWPRPLHVSKLICIFGVFAGDKGGGWARKGLTASFAPHLNTDLLFLEVCKG